MRYKLRTSLALTCVALAGILMAGCGKEEPAPGGTSTPVATPAATGPITIGYSDWPGWTCWDIAEKQGFFKKEGVDVKLVWFANYTDSLNAFAAKQVDANCQTWGDTMGPLAAGQDAKVVIVNDNSAGNDAMVAKAGINSVKDLKGKTVATELGTVDHFLMLKALEANGMKESDVKYVNIKVQDCPAAMIGGKIDACVVWEPNKSQLLDKMKGAHVIFDSKSIPGLIPDLLVFQGPVVASRKADVQKIVNAWYDTMAWWRANPDEAVKIMAARTGSPVTFYKGFIMGTRIFDGPEALGAFTKSTKVTSLYTSGQSVAEFLVAAKQIPKVPDFESALDMSFTKAAVDAGLGKQPPYDYKLKVD
ncbi:MAG TPA: ABC transporter substrate-binding protein [Capsulimonadaceae bacterium]|jgi:NitT/TauT family transport system substrate-binding protein